MNRTGDGAALGRGGECLASRLGNPGGHLEFYNHSSNPPTRLERHMLLDSRTR